MSIFLLHNPLAVFIHVPKTGGSTIRDGLWGGKHTGPVFDRVPDAWRKHYKFAFVRHPFDRLQSAWRDFTTLRGARMAFREFVDIVLDESIPHTAGGGTRPAIRHHTIPQTHPSNCLDAADFVGRYENYATDLASVLCRLGVDIPAELPRIRRTLASASDEALGDEMCSRINEYYRMDFEELGYDFAAPKSRLLR